MIQWMRREDPMDLFWIGLALALLAAARGLVALCDRLRERP